MHTGAQKLLTSLRIDRTGVPIYVQLREQLLRAIGAGLIPPGGQMPTMRQVAVAVRVDLNTVRHAYEELERSGAIVLVRGRGSFVSQSPPDPGREPAAERLDDLAHQALASAATSGIDPIALAERIIALRSKQEN